MSSASLNYAAAHVRGALAALSTLFVPGVKLTFLMRNPALPDGSMLISDDEPEEIERALRVLRKATEPTAAVRDVLAEREKQRAKWGDAHDNEHEFGALAVVAAALAVKGTDAHVDDPLERVNFVTGQDCWGLIEKHPEQRDQLVIAAALLLADIERIDRRDAKRAATPLVGTLNATSVNVVKGDVGTLDMGKL